MIGDEMRIDPMPPPAALEGSRLPPSALALHPSLSIVSPQALALRAIPFASKRLSSFPMLPRSTSPGSAVVAHARPRP